MPIDSILWQQIAHMELMPEFKDATSKSDSFNDEWVWLKSTLEDWNTIGQWRTTINLRKLLTEYEAAQEVLEDIFD